MKVNEMLKNRMMEDDDNFVHADNEVLETYEVSKTEVIAFRDELGLLWIDDPSWGVAYVSDDDQHPDDENTVWNLACGVLLSVKQKHQSPCAARGGAGANKGGAWLCGKIFNSK